MRWSRAIPVALALLTAACAPSSTPHVGEPSGGGGVPTKALILGVPFVSFDEAAQISRTGAPLASPSFLASTVMFLSYWGVQPTAAMEQLRHFKQLKRFSGTGGKGKGVDALKPWIARQIPVIVSTAITPIAHTPDPSAMAFATVGGKKRNLTTRAETDAFAHRFFEIVGPSSGLLGRMERLETFRRLETPWESLLESHRVVIGYDDDRRVIILHDAAFGPAWEVRYDDFERMWDARDRWGGAAVPPEFEKILASRLRPEYPPRTPDQRAAEQYVLGYALSSTSYFPA
jgi:hypothetical protein